MKPLTGSLERFPIKIILFACYTESKGPVSQLVNAKDRKEEKIQKNAMYIDFKGLG